VHRDRKWGFLSFRPDGWAPKWLSPDGKDKTRQVKNESPPEQQQPDLDFWRLRRREEGTLTQVSTQLLDRPFLRGDAVTSGHAHAVAKNGPRKGRPAASEHFRLAGGNTPAGMAAGIAAAGAEGMAASTATASDTGFASTIQDGAIVAAVSANGADTQGKGLSRTDSAIHSDTASSSFPRSGGSAHVVAPDASTAARLSGHIVHGEGASVQSADQSLSHAQANPHANPGASATKVRGAITVPNIAHSGPIDVSSIPVGYIPTAQAAPVCCGSCGYVNCPTQLLSHGDASLLRGQWAGSGMPGGADYISPRKTFGASISAMMPTDQVSLLTYWDRNTAAPSASLPGGGETGSGTATGQIGILSGAVTTMNNAQTRAAAAQSVQSLAAAAAVTNPIVLENQKTGNPESEWGIDGAGSSNIEGFATDISVNLGQTVSFKIDTNSSNYRIDIYRMGYYGGMGARKVATIQHTGVQNQPDPLRDNATGLVDAGNWAVSASWNVPTDAASGVYIAKLVRQDGTFGENHIPFIVRDDSSHSDIIFQTADETWQAYNGWGGANFYGGNGPATGQGAGRAYALSYNRPIATRGGVGTYAGPQDYLFGAEYAAISWLEQNGYDVSYMAGVDVDRYGSLLLNHKMYLDVGHDEYWSGQQRTNVEAARDAGVNLSFWSGNEMYWRTRWGNSISADGTPYRTLISYKETWANTSIDPTSQWTGTFRDPRFSPPAVGGGSPENAVTGQIFQVDDVGSALQSIRVPYDDANLRFWRNTSVANLQSGQTATLTKNYLGYEWDEASDNGFDPAGLVKLSSTTLQVSTYLLDYGNTTGNGTSTHNLTLYRAPSGALVFGAGTVYWAWGLSDNHDKEVTPTDARVQQAMVNLFADMGIQPATLQSGLITGLPSTDHTAPTSTINAINSVSAGSVVTISGTATDTGGGVIAGVEVSTDNGLSWHPATGDETWTYSWSPQLAGTYTIRSRAVDDSVNLETPSAGRTATITGPNYKTVFSPTATPAVVNTTDASAVELGMKFRSSVAGTVNGIRFYKSSQDTGTHTGALWSSTGVKLGTLTFTNETASGWQMATFSSPITITAGQTYTASYHTNVGRYSNTINYFTADVTNGPLTALGGNNGVYAYGSNSIFPTTSISSTNFWVDVMFTSSAPNTPPTALADAATAVEKGGTLNGDSGANATGNVLANDTDPDSGDTETVTAVRFGATNGTVGTALAGAYGSLVLNAGGAFTYTINDANATVQALRPTSTPLFEVFNYTMQDASGSPASSTLTITIQGANDAPVVAIQTGNQTGVVGTPFSLTLPQGTFTDVDAGDGLTYSATQGDGSNLPSWLIFDAANRSFSGTPPSVGTTTVKVTATDAGGLTTFETFTIGVTLTPNAPPVAVADTASALEKGGVLNGTTGTNPAGNVLVNDTDPDAGDTKTVTAVRFGSTNGTLGTALAGTYGNLVLNSNGDFSYTLNDSAAAVQALRSSDAVADVFTYTMRDTAGVTATTTLTINIQGANDAPVLASQTANQNTLTGSAFSLTLPVGTFTDVDAGETLAYTATLADGSALPSWLSFNAATRTFSGTPASAGTLNIKVTATDLGGLTATEGFSVAVATAPTVYSLFNASSTPTQTNLNDGQQLEVGLKFSSNMAGLITAIKFYRTASDTGQNLVNLWTSTGTNLATATFTNTSAVGWQTVALSAPVAITANTTYVASYHTTGAYVATDNFFTTALTNGPLTAPSGTNGVYRYGGSATAGIFPNSSFASANYYADVVFAPAVTNTAPTAVADTGTATEKGGVANGAGGSTATGNVVTNDTDPDAGDTRTVTAVSFNTTNGTLGSALAGLYGSLLLNANGTFTYTVNDGNATVQALRQPANVLTEVFNYTMRDTAGATSSSTLTITIQGANDAPTLASQTANQNAVVGSAFSLVLPTGTFNDVDAGENLTYSATLSDGSALPAWLSFNAATRAFSGTPATGDAGTYSVKVTATDLGSLAISETFTVTVTVPNTTPVAVADSAIAIEAGGVANATVGPPVAGNVLVNDTDPDAGDTKTVTAVRFGTTNGTLGTGLAGTYGTLVLGATGGFTYSLNDNLSVVQALRQSTDVLTDSFTYTMRDTAGATSSNTLTITIQGANDAPTLASQTTNQNAFVGSAFSLVLPAGTFNDVDTGDSLTYDATTDTGALLPAWFSFNATTRTFNGTPGAGDIGTYNVRVTATDLGNLAISETFTVTVTMPNTPPLAAADSAIAIEAGGIGNVGGALATGNVLDNDFDPDAGDAKSVSAVSFGGINGTIGTGLAGAYGTLVLGSSGGFTYTLNDNNTMVQGLRPGSNPLVETFNYTMRDTIGQTSSSTLTITIQGTNDAPTIASQTANQNAFAGSAFSLILPAGTFNDVDTGDTLTYTARTTADAPLPGWLSFDAANRTFSGTPTAADTGALGIKVTATDAGGLAISETFTVTVTVPNTPPTAVADTAGATEAGGLNNNLPGAPATGNVLSNDIDPDAGDSKTVTAIRFGATNGTLGSSLAGAYGSLVLSATGDFTYAVNDNNTAVQNLRTGSTPLTDTFSYTMRDTAGVTSTNTLTISIQGANDSPVLASQTSNQNAAAGSAFSLTLAAGTFTDVDVGDTMTYTATLADNSALPSWLSFNASTRTFSGTPAAANAGTLNIKVTATDSGTLSASENFNLAVAASAPTYSLFSASATPTQVSNNDGRQIELGVKFSANVAGQITALKFYRSPSDTGQNVVDLWTSTGTKLATANFSGTTGSGWQTVNLAAPVSITANTTYVASYHTTGAYAATNSFFTTPLTSGPLTAPSGTNGVYRYGGSATAGIFPNSSFSSSNYYADVVFRPTLVS